MKFQVQDSVQDFGHFLKYEILIFDSLKIETHAPHPNGRKMLVTFLECWYLTLILKDRGFCQYRVGDSAQICHLYLNSHHTRKGNAWKFVQTLHVKFFPFGCREPPRMVTVKHLLKP